MHTSGPTQSVSKVVKWVVIAKRSKIRFEGRIITIELKNSRTGSEEDIQGRGIARIETLTTLEKEFTSAIPDFRIRMLVRCDRGCLREAESKARLIQKLVG